HNPKPPDILLKYDFVGADPGGVLYNMIIIRKAVVIAFLYNIVLVALTENDDLIEYRVSPVDIVYPGERFGLFYGICLNRFRFDQNGPLLHSVPAYVHFSVIRSIINVDCLECGV